MVRQYKIHTNLDGTDDKVWDVTNGKVRFYQPSNLGLQSTNNIWQSNGIGVMGTRSITQPQIEFKLETFGESLEENYQLMKDFINDILSQKFVTLEYQTEIFQVYADLALSDVTKTEGYGKNGTFSEKITFDIITKWYTYENLTFEMIENGQIISGKSKVYGGYKGNETALQNYNRLKANPSLNLPNLNLEQHTKKLVDENNTLLWGIKASATDTMTYEPVNITGSKNIVHGVHVTQTTSGQAGWRSPSYSVSPYVEVGNNSQVTRSVYIKNNATTDLDVSLTIGYSGNADGSSPKYLNDDITVPANSDFALYKGTLDLPETAKYIWFYVYTRNPTTSADFTFAGYKAEWGSEATDYLPYGSELTTDDISEYFGYNYIKNQAYTYYGEENIERLSRWDIKDEIFSFVGVLYPHLAQQVAGVRFLDDIGNEYTAIVFNTEELQDYIFINTDVNDEIYQGWSGTTSLNLFPVLDFERYRTRIIEKGQMQLINLSKAEFKVKRKADFV